MKTNTLVPCGFLYTMGRTYFLIKPHPLELEGWEDADFDRRFLGVPDIRVDFIEMEKDTFKNIYACPREIVVSADYVVEYDVSIKPILCEVPEDVLDTLFDEMVNKQGALE